MRLYFKNRSSPKAYKVVITSKDNSQLGFIGDITNPTMKIGGGKVQFYLAPIESQGSWTLNPDYHLEDGILTVMGYKNLLHTSYNSHATYSNFSSNITLALAYQEFHNFSVITEALSEISGIRNVQWNYDQENKRFIWFTDNEAGNVLNTALASKINDLLRSPDLLVKFKAEDFVRAVVDDYFLPSPKGLFNTNTFNGQLLANAVLTKLGSKEYTDTYVTQATTASLNFTQGLDDRIPSAIWMADGEGTVIVGGKAFANNVFSTTGTSGDSLKSPSTLLSGGRNPFTISFELLIKENQVNTGSWPNLAIFSKNTNDNYGEQSLFIDATDGYRLAFKRESGVGGNTIQTVRGLRRIEFNTKFFVKIVYDSNMFKVFVNDVLDFQFGSIVGWFTESDQPYRFLDSYNPVFTSLNTRSFTKGIVDNIQIQNGVAHDPSVIDNVYKDNLVHKLRFQGQVGKTSFVDEVNEDVVWTGFGDAKLATSDILNNYSHLSLDGMSSYLSANNPDLFKFVNKFTFHFKFKTSVTSKKQVLFDKLQEGLLGSYQFALSEAGQILYTKGTEATSLTFAGTQAGLNNGTVQNVSIIKDGDSLSFYINGLLDIMLDVTGDVFNASVETSAIGAKVNERDESFDFKGNIYSFIVYKGIADYPTVESLTLDKSELNFDLQRPVDIYNNMNWFNQNPVNYVKSGNFGYSANLDSSGVLKSYNSYMNFGANPFSISLDIKCTESNQYSTIVNSMTTNGTQNGAWIGRTNVNGYKLGFGINGGHEAYSSVPLELNSTYKIGLHKTNGSVFGTINDVIVSSINRNTSINFSDGGGTQLGHGWANNYSSNKFIGTIDRFKVEKAQTLSINAPSVHLPLTSHYTSIGYDSVTTTTNGASLTYVDGRDCLSTSNGSLNLGNPSVLNFNDSPFLISLDIYILSGGNEWQGIISKRTNSSSEDYCLCYQSTTRRLFLEIGRASNNTIGKIFVDIPEGLVSNWINVKINNDGTDFKLIVNDDESLSAKMSSFPITSTSRTFCVGILNEGGGYNFSGYVSDLKVFAGTSTIPSAYNPTYGFNIDFKPKNESYLFKDNFNRCVLQSTTVQNIGYDTDYHFIGNGTNSFINLSKASHLNFGKSDFILNIKFKLASDYNKNSFILANGSTNLNNRSGVQILEDKRIRLVINAASLTTTEVLEVDRIYDLKIKKDSIGYTLYLNDAECENPTFDSNFHSKLLNLNDSNETYIGKNNWESAALSTFKGNIYKLACYRDTTDLTLFEEEYLEPENPNDIILVGPPPLVRGVLNFWEPRQEVDPNNVVLEFKQLRLS